MAEYLLLFTPRYGVQMNSFTLTGSVEMLAYDLAGMLAKCGVITGPWRIRNVEDEQLVIVENDKKRLYLIDQPGILHNMAFTWCAGDGRYTVQMFDLNPNNPTK